MSQPPLPLGVNVAVIDQGRVLLTRREDFEVWCMPGGSVEVGESLAEAAIRETREETGLEVELTHLVGLYSRPNFGGYHTLAVFAGRIVGGQIDPDPREVVEIGFFTADQIPADLLFDQRERIQDVLAGYGGSVVRTTTRTRPAHWPASRAELYAMRDRSGLARRAFYQQMTEPFGQDSYQLEVGGEKR
jgi:8-oxo-dGTP diphosphatase